MQQNKLHIVSFDVPYPADYGGAIDVFYKVKSLSEAGCEIYLHCYEYGRGYAAELKKYCKEVHYYKRTTGIMGVSLSLPYIVSSRRSDELLKRLQKIDAPILFEGVHTTYFLSHPSLRDRFKAIRAHNVEHEYYLKLAGKEPSFFKKTYYRSEAALLKKYEGSLHNANAFFALSITDAAHFQKQYPDIKSTFVPPFHQYDAVSSQTGTGTYCLYHGNLSHPENREAALFLLDEVIPNMDVPFIIAGKNPGEDIVAACHEFSNCTLVPNPGSATMNELVANAHIHVLPTFQQSGMKLKLLAALYGGRHVVVNDDMLIGTGLNNACSITNTGQQFIKRIKELMQQPFTEEDKTSRKTLLTPYDKATNARALLNMIA